MKRKKIKLKRKKAPEKVLKEHRKKKKLLTKKPKVKKKTTKLPPHVQKVKDSHDRGALEMAVLKLTISCASLQMTQDDWVEFSPLPGTCGVIKMRGSVNPTFQYTTFDRSIMCFVRVTVEVSKPAKINYFAQILSPEDANTEAVSVRVREEYKIPFQVLMNKLMAYFPFWKSDTRLDHTFNAHRGATWGFYPYNREVDCTYQPTPAKLRNYKKATNNGIHYSASEPKEQAPIHSSGTETQTIPGEENHSH